MPSWISALDDKTGFAGEAHRRSGHAPGATGILLALGIVYGDLGTSPLYTLQTIVHLTGDGFTREAALGSLSLIFWALIITISVKYCLFVMRADNHGEGGILALMALTGARWSGRGRWLVALGLFGAALIYGDGIITPAISVLSAVEGLNVATSAFRPYTMPIAVGILIALFAFQRHGTATVGKAFGPVMLLWFVTMALLGIASVVRHPDVIGAVNPMLGLRLLATHGVLGFTLLGGVFLALTGGEALYADMGHVGRGPIRIAWYGIVLPALLLNYAGQVGNFVASPDRTANPFFKLAPVWGIYPLVTLATLATIIASQAIITGSFSMTRQAMQLGWFPGVRINQTSAEEYGQIYVPFVNWTMMCLTVALTIGFGSSDRLAGAYGAAVSTTMVLTTALLYRVMRRRWRWGVLHAGAIAGLLLTVDLAFFLANLFKIAEGGWIPLLFGTLVFAIMTTWHFGIDALHRRSMARSQHIDAFFNGLREQHIARVPGTAIFLTRLGHRIPPIIVDYVRQAHSLHRTAVALTVSFESVPRIRSTDRIRCEQLCEGIWHITTHFGFVEIPDLPNVLSNAKEIGVPIRNDPTYYVERHDLINGERRNPIARLRIALFAFMSRNAAHAIDRFKIPSASLIEIGSRMEL
ncbi:KUP/HAK/KT family potassium transporter [Bradyrhizobium jicamae]|uniref:Probable potassium transport system protein Kup n=1 Tax=Bradyrhizobium jicamae TaxID=280332 RepID=A0ABS5FNY0_9BRAD|nr:KUP/HAK/KT family potassium transporter [Bradyrhizobium jicamae]MBR0798498.1 KUP/HAK/KT family potassium transporter [Bradyrhizobium jicamae]